MADPHQIQALLAEYERPVSTKEIREKLGSHACCTAHLVVMLAMMEQVGLVEYVERSFPQGWRLPPRAGVIVSG